MATLSELLAQKADLTQQLAATEAEIAAVQNAGRPAAISDVRALMAKFGLTAVDIGGGVRADGASKAAKPTGKVAVKYRNAATGETWTGRGLKPKWMVAALAAGAKIDDFTV